MLIKLREWILNNISKIKLGGVKVLEDREKEMAKEENGKEHNEYRESQD